MSRITREIERTLRRGTSTPHTKHDKEKTKRYILEIKRILGALTSLNPPLDGNLSGGEGTPNTAPRESAMVGTAYGSLVRHEFTPHELPSLIEAILSSNDDCEKIRCLPRGDAQTFVDMIDEARSTFTRYRETNINMFWKPGIGFARSLPIGSKEMP